MKEIDKIRIKQWNQDNPYIQMKNLENAQPGYRVHTVNDDHHLYELPLETQNIILDWVFWNFYPAQKIYPHLTSDDLKEVLFAALISLCFLAVWIRTSDPLVQQSVQGGYADQWFLAERSE